MRPWPASTTIRTHQVIDRKVSLCEIAPTLLAIAGVTPDHKFDAAPMAEAVETAVLEAA